MLAYTFNQLLTEQAVVERDMSTGDAYGASTGPDWQYHLTAPCRLWWDRSTGVRSANRTFVTPAREVPLDEGGMVFPMDTDIGENDRITVINVFNRDTGTWEPYVEGLFTITAVIAQEDHLEVDVTHAHLGEN